MVIKFDLSTIPQGAKIKEAKLSFYVYGVATGTQTLRNGPKRLHKITAQWQESSVTWSNKPRYSSTQLANSNNSSTRVWEDYTVTSAIKEYVEQGEDNFGFVLKFSESSGYYGIRIRSSEASNQSERPKLTITYDIEDQQAPTVSVTAPTAGESVEGGATYTIKWNAQDDIGVVSRAIYLISASSSIKPLIDSASGNTGTFQWSVPNQSLTGCKIQVFAYDAAGNQGKGESGAFSIDMVSIVNPRFNLPFAGKYNVIIRNLQGKKLAEYEIYDLKKLTEIKTLFPSGMHIISISIPGRCINRQFYTVK